MYKLLLVLGLILFAVQLQAQVSYVDIKPDQIVKAVAPQENDDFYINMDGIGNDDFFFNHVISGNGTPFNPNHVDFHINHLKGAEILALGTNVMNLGYGAIVDSNQKNWKNPNYPLVIGGQTYVAKVSIKLHTQFAGMSDGYIGVRFKINNLWHYGWILIEVPNDVSSIIVKEFAYNTTAEEAILAGYKNVSNSILPIFNKTDFRFGPNPANQQLNVVVTEKGILSIFSAQGRLVFSQNLDKGEHKINTINYKPGLYFIRFGEANGNNKSSKLIIH